MSTTLDFEQKVAANASNQKKWLEYERTAVKLSSVVSELWYDKSIELVIYRKPLLDCSASEIIQNHSYARVVSKTEELSVNETFKIASAINKLDIAPARIDIGKLTGEWFAERANYANEDAFVADKLSSFIGKDKWNGSNEKGKDVVLYGFGRIGRLMARELITQAGTGLQLNLRAIVVRGYSDTELVRRAALLRNDSIHGHFAGTIQEDFENRALIINGQTIYFIDAKNPEDVDYTQYGIKDALLVDNTGVYRDREGLGRHLEAKGIDKVLLTAPGKGDIPNIVYGINHNNFDVENEKIWSAASCTTNAIVPVLKVVNDNIGIENGHVETVHAYTNDQNLLDNYHKGYRRGRSAALNMVITETGAAKAVNKVLPELSGKLTGNAVRVPIPDGSLAILVLNLSKSTSLESLNEIVKKEALYGELVEQIQFAYSNELVSSDIIGNPWASIYDSKATIVSEDGKRATLYVWYDNEYGYTRQVMRLAKHIAKVRRLTYY